MKATRIVASEAGLLLVDKPSGETSHDVVLRVRRALGIRRAGHTGTLDPFATGLLLVLVGPLTRLAELYHGLSKSYEATLELGRETDTDDTTGEVRAESAAWRDRSEAEILDAFAARAEETTQVPSTYSAVRVEGQRAYEIAREGRQPELVARDVTIHELSIREIAPPRVRFDVRVSTGTYVRALARDIGRDLECGAHLTSLRRTEIGSFRVADAVEPGGLDQTTLEGAAWCSGADVVPWIRRRRLSDEEAGDVLQGRTVPRGDLEPAVWSEPSALGAVALLSADRLLAIAASRGENLHPKKVFPV